MKIFRLALTMGMTFLIKRVKTDDKELVKLLISRFEGDFKGSTQTLKNKMCTSLLNDQKGERSRCSNDQIFSLVRNTKIMKYKDKESFMMNAAYLIANHTQIVYNITKNWLPYFDKKANDILSKKSSSLICQLASYKWFTMNKDVNAEDFFSKVYKPNATKCTEFLSKTRSSFLCNICDKTVTNETIYLKNKGMTNVQAVVCLKEKSCDFFLRDCMDYIDNKRLVVERLNIEFVLSLCDSDGVFIAREDKKNWKKVMPSKTLHDQEKIRKCRRFQQNRVMSNGSDSNTLADYPMHKENSLACKQICERYFSVDMMISDDIEQYNNFRYMHHILEQVILGNVTESTYTEGGNQGLALAKQFGDTVMFKFNNSYITGKDKVDDDGLNWTKKEPFEIFLNQYTKANRIEFPVEKYVKRIGLMGTSVVWIIQLSWWGLLN